MLARLRSVGLATAVIALAASTASALPASAEDNIAPVAAAVSPTDTDDDGVLDASSTAAAAAGAAETDEPVEDLSQRTSTTSVIANADHTFTSKQFGSPVRVKRGGDWVDVDYTLTSKADGSWAPKAAPVDVSIDGGSAKEAARVTFDDGESLAVTWPADLPEPTVSGGVATYKLSAVTDLVIAVTSTGVNARIRLNQRPVGDDPVFTLGLRAEGVDLDQTVTGSLKVTGDDGKTIARTSAMVAWDATTDAAGDPADVVNLDATLDQTARTGDVTQHTLGLTTPDGFLTDPRTQYPVTIDPDISMNKVRDTWVRAGDTASHATDQRLIVGKIDPSTTTNPGPTRSYLKFYNSTIEDNPGIDVVSAELGLWQYYGYDCSPRRMNVYPVGVNWDDTITWANKPDAVVGGYSSYVSDNRAASGCASGWTKVNLTTMAKAWATGDVDMQGLRLTAADEDYSSYERRFCSMNTTSGTDCNTASRTPYLSVTYDDPEPGLPAMTSYGVDEYMLEDLQEIAATEQISLSEAVNRYGWQNEFADLAADVQATYPDLFSAAEINTTGTPGATIDLTSDASASESAAVTSMGAAADLPVPIAVQDDAKYTEPEELTVVSVAHDAVIAAAGTQDVSTSYDESADIVRAIVGGSSASESAVESAVANSISQDLPPIAVPGVDVTVQSASATQDETLRGGAVIGGGSGGDCTSGWPVKVNGLEQYGLITAEHCADDHYLYAGRSALKYTSSKLPSSRGDIEYHERNGEGVGRSFYYAVGKTRAIQGIKKTVKGQYLCLFGRNTKGTRNGKPTCSKVGKLNTSRGKYDGLASMGSYVSNNGDSGGPWYSGGWAYGVHSGRHTRLLATRSQFTPVWGNVSSMNLSVRKAD